MRPANYRRPGLFAGLAVAAIVTALWTHPAQAASDTIANPYLGDDEAIAAGRRVYRAKCIICHGRAGGRGPNLFQSEIDAADFRSTVLNGRADTQMPAFGARLTEDEVWHVHAFVRGRGRY